MSSALKNSDKALYLSPEDAIFYKNSENCILEEGVLRRRPAVFAKREEWLYDNNSDRYAATTLKMTDCYLFVDGKYCRVAVSIADNEVGNVEYAMRLVFADGRVRDIGTIFFVRSTPQSFGQPTSFTVFGGEAVGGCGIFFISRQVYENGSEDLVRVLELDANMQEWNPVMDAEMYFPTLLANGRGENYHLAAPGGERVTLKSPIYPESRNMLSGGFKSFFTADSASTAFTLPLDGLDAGAIYGYYTGADKVYSFKIEASATTSEGVTVGGVSVKMNCNRTLGRIYFTRSDGTPWAPDYTGNHNSLEFRAYKTDRDNKIKIAAMTGCCRIGGEGGQGETKTTLFYGNDISPSAVVVGSSKHPLYFPEDGLQLLGEPQLPVLDVVIKEQGPFVFKENEVYSAVSSSGKAPYQPSKEGNTTVDREVLSFKRVATLSSAPEKNTVVLVGRDIFYTNRQGDILKIGGNGTSLKTERIKASATTLEKGVFAVAFRGGYLLIEGKNCIALYKGEKGYNLFGWTLPERMTGGFSYMDEAVLFASLEEGDTRYVYPVTFGGLEDCKIVADGSARRLEKQEVSSKFTPKIRKCEYESLRLLALSLRGDFREVWQITAEGHRRPLTVRNGEVILREGFETEPSTFGFVGDFSIVSVSALCRNLKNM